MAEQEKQEHKIVIDRKKSIKLQKISEKTLTAFTEELASVDGKPETGCVGALVAALAPSLGTLAASLVEIDPEGEHKALLKELDEMRKYMLRQADDMHRSRSPLMKRIAENADGMQIESAARLACGIPNEIVYLMCRCMELLDQLAPVCRAEDKTTIQAAVYLCLAVISVMRGQIDFYASYMEDDSFRYVVKREAELNVQEHQALIDKLLAPLE